MSSSSLASTGGSWAAIESEMLAVWRRSDIAPAEAAAAARLLRILLETEGAASSSAATVLRHSGIRTRWNDILANARSAFLAEWLAPLLRPPVLDLLAGDLTVARALRASGVAPILATERRDHYPALAEADPLVAFEPFPETGPLPGADCETVLVSAVLHHEPDPVALLDRVAALPARRWVVVENCLVGPYDEVFHQRIDVFFNQCLNEFGLACVPEHRTVDGWRRLLAAYGEIVAVEERAVPGIPFPYQTFVVDR